MCASPSRSNSIKMKSSPSAMAILAEQRGLLAEAQSESSQTSRKPLRTPRGTKTYDDNFDFALSFYQPMIDYLDKKSTDFPPFDRKELPHLPYVDERCLLEPLRLKNTATNNANVPQSSSTTAQPSISKYNPELTSRIRGSLFLSQNLTENKSSKLQEMIEASEGKKEKERKVVRLGCYPAPIPELNLLSTSSGTGMKKSTLCPDTDGREKATSSSTSRVKLGVSKSTSSSAHFSPTDLKTFSLTKSSTMNELASNISNRKLFTTSRDMGQDDTSSHRCNADLYGSKLRLGESSSRADAYLIRLSKSRSIGALTMRQASQDSEDKLRGEKMKAIVDKYHKIMGQENDGNGNEVKVLCGKPPLPISRLGRFQSLNVKNRGSGEDRGICGLDRIGVGLSRFGENRKSVHLQSPPGLRTVEIRNKGINVLNDDAEYWKGLW